MPERRSGRDSGRRAEAPGGDSTRRTAGGRGTAPRRAAADRRAASAARTPRRQDRAGQDRTRELRRVEPPPGTDPRRLDPGVRQALRSLTPGTADRVAAHLVAAGELIDHDPLAALEQARAARAFAPRIGVVREAAGLTAYAAGEWQEALAELRAERRLTGSVAHLPVMADCERGLGRPERALDMAQSADAQRLDAAGRIEMQIVASGARRDLGQAEAAVVLLQSLGLNRDNPQPWSARLWYAYADALLDAGRPGEAREWFDAVTRIDDGETDAEERLLALDPPPAPSSR